MNPTERQYAEADKITLPDTTITSLSGHIQKCFDEAQTDKMHLLNRLLKCERQRKGEYEPELKAQLKEMGVQPIFMMLTDIKCRAADSWIKDVMQNHSQSTWALNHTTEPDLPPELMQEIMQMVAQEAAMVAQQGYTVDHGPISARQDQVIDEVKVSVAKEADQRVNRMQDRIEDKMEEGGYRDALSQMIYDFTTYPAAIMKGPVLRKKKVMKWGPEFKPVVSEVLALEFERVSPYDVFPSPQAVSIQDGFLIHRQKITRSEMRNMIGLKGADKDAIEGLLRRFPTGYKETRPGDAAHETINERYRHSSPDGMFEALEYWGPVSGIMLKEWGLVLVDGQPVDDYEEYQINAWKIANEVIRVVLNPHPLNMRPYSKASFVDVPGAFWGRALPELMEDTQVMCNASARALAMNMGIASGPQVEVCVDRMAAGARLESMYPWKLWQTTIDRTGGGQPAIRFSQPDMHAEELLGVYTFFSKQADEVTGVPNYIYGSTAVSGAGRTASGLSMLMENASKGIKHAILSLDAATSEVVGRTYLHLMLHDPDQSIKGDMNIVAAGAIGAMIREQQESARAEFMQQTLNPVDMQIIGTTGRAYMLREHAKSLFSDVNKVVPDPEQLKMQMALQQGGMPPGAPGMPPPQPSMGAQPAAPAQLVQ